MRAILSIKFHPDQGNRARIEAILAALSAAGISTGCVVRDLEEWGQRHYPPSELMRLTFAELDACDLLVVDLTEKGVGVGIEAGYAAARGKPIVVIAPAGADISDTLAGIALAVLRYDELSALPETLKHLPALLLDPQPNSTHKEAPMDVFTLLDQIRIIARNGLNYTRDGYDRERYERLMLLATHAYAERLDLQEDSLRARFLAELGHITPKVGADAAIFNERGELLLMERADGSGWCLPCGWVEPDESPAQAAVREAREETGLQIAVDRLVGVFHRPASAKNGPHAMIAVVHLCSVLGGELTLSHEGLDLRYWPIDAVPVWHATHAEYAQAAFAIWQELKLPNAGVS